MNTSKRRKKYNTVPQNKQRMPKWVWIAIMFFAFLLLIGIWHYRAGIAYYLRATFDSTTEESAESKKHDARNIFLMSRHKNYVFGIDISQYQGDILWDSISTINPDIPVDFIFVRASMGESARDKRFEHNWLSVHERNKLRGAYHYYRPNENSLRQAENFTRTVKLKAGDLPPVLDIEERPKQQSMDSLKVGLKRWLTIVESHYGVRPIIYSGDSYYTDFLEKEFKDYVLWIANYNFWIESPKEHWTFWQFSEKGSVPGVRGPVDLNMFKGTIEQLEDLCIPYR